jgi:23S rRNA (pseudouridine1915-N3)-methyltransferase
MKWALYDFKTAKEPWFDEAEALYTKKIKAFVSFEVVHLKTLKSERSEATIKKKHEGQRLLEKLTSDDYVILLDEKGKKADSLEFAKIITQAQNSAKKRLVFIVGGAYGVDEQIKQLSQKVISLSDLTMNHLVAEAVLLEQIYRALTIINRIPYHNI